MTMINNINAFRKKVERIPNLPTLPTVVTTILDLLDDPKTTAKDVNEALTQDQAISSKILKLSNSAFYGFSRKISTITDAVVLLGFNTVSSLAISASVFASFFGTESTGFSLEEFWKHSIGTGVIAKLIAKKLKYKNLETAFISGVIHDIGKTILVQYFSEQFMEALEYSDQNNIELWRAELKTIGVAHSEIGAWIASHWKFPDPITNAINYHHLPIAYKDTDLLVYIISYADWLSKTMQIGYSGSKVIEAPHNIVFSKLGFTPTISDELIDEINIEVEKSKIFFAIAEN